VIYEVIHVIYVVIHLISVVIHVIYVIYVVIQTKRNTKRKRGQVGITKRNTKRKRGRQVANESLTLSYRSQSNGREWVGYYYM
jgi:hypothetical protein